ncbi:MAG: winged helix-turn-helix transcriptional regulator [Gemmatimonadetes bacterium]|nr:winged helix-turn-helix transcriptional regulator [Gemmatimonadota bacterium]
MIESKYLEPSPRMRELQLMELLADQPESSQSLLAERVGLTPARVNAYIRAFSERGHLVAEQRARGMAYRLTSEGRRCLAFHQVSYRAELVRLTRSARDRFRAFFRELGDRGVRRVVLYGAGETGEVVLDALAGCDWIEVVAVLDDDPARQMARLHGVPVMAPSVLSRLAADAVVVTAVTASEGVRARIRALGDERLPVYSIAG